MGEKGFPNLSKPLQVWIDIEPGNPLSENSIFCSKWHSKNVGMLGVENWF